MATQEEQLTEQLQEDQLVADFAEAQMPPMQAHWLKVIALARTLDPKSAKRDDDIRVLNPQHKNAFVQNSKEVIWLVSKKNPLRRTSAGRIFAATPYNAAQCIVNDTHELATSDQVAKYNREQAQRRVDAANLKTAQNPPQPVPVINVNLTAEDSKAIREGRKTQVTQQPS